MTDQKNTNPVVEKEAGTDYGMSSKIESPAQLAWKKFRKSRPAIIGGNILIGLYIIAALCGFFSPYRYDSSFKEHSFRSPDLMSLHFSNESGTASLLHPVIYGSKTVYVDGSKIVQEDLDEEYRLQWFVSGESYKILALIPSSKHLFGLVPVTEQARIKWDENVEKESLDGRYITGYPLFLFGADQAGRDIFSRLLYGSQISLTIGLIGIMISFSIGIVVGGISGFYGDQDLKPRGATGTALRMLVAITVAQFLSVLSFRVGWDLFALSMGLVLFMTLFAQKRYHSEEDISPAYVLMGIWGGVIAIFMAIAHHLFQNRGVLKVFAFSDMGSSPVMTGVIILPLIVGVLIAFRSIEKVDSLVPLDTVIMRSVEVIMSLPGLYLILTLRSVFPKDMESWKTYIMVVSIMSFVYWASLSRVIRGMVLSLKEQEYVLACRAMGAKDWRILRKHVLPNTMTFVIVQATLTIPYYILGEVTLSFLGVGIQEPYASWGTMLEAAKSVANLENSPWVLVPAAAIFITVMAYNFLGDGLRDALDPRQKS